jgi:hypothetical protein
MQNHGNGADGRGKQSRADAAETGDQKNRQRQQQQAETRDDESTEKRNREQFLSAFSQGLVVLGYERDARENGAFLLGRWDETWSYAATD